MKFRRITIFGLTLALAGTLTAFAACTDPENTGETPPEYTFEDGRPDGELTAPDEGFEIDGVLDEAAYSSIRWLEGPVLRPYYTSDGQGVYYDYDVIQERTQSAAQVRMGTYYGENGVYIAYSYQEQAGKVCYVNPSRRSYRNSGVELHIGIPSSATMTGDETISRLTVNANGALTIAKTQGDIWMAPYGTEDHANMPYVGLTGNGTRTDENADRTEYTFELFIPWGYFDEVGGEGTAQSMKDGGDLVVAPGIITANNYTGTGQTDREYYVLSARLDDGEWSNAQGWYHFNRDGVVAYDIEIAQPQNGSVQEWMGYDTAAKNSSLTFVTKANEGYALKEFRVNGVAVPRDYIHYDMYTTLGADAESNVQKAYIKIPEKEITGDVSVEAVFEPLASGEQTLVATVYGESTENPLANATVTFTRGDEVKTATTDENGTFTLSGLTAGLYDVAVNDLTYRKLTDYVFFSPAANAQIVFELNEFALEGSENVEKNYTEIQGKVGSLEGGFVFSGFFGFEGAEFDDLTTFTATVNFRLEDGTQYGFRFTKWNQYVVLKCEQREWSFADNSAAMAYMREQGGVYFMFAVDPNGEQDNGISVYIKQDANTWVQLALSGGSGDYAFPFDKEVTSINFGKQDDSDAAHTAVLEDGKLQIGTCNVNIPVTVTVNGGEQVTGGEVSVTESASLGETITVTLTPEDNYELSALEVDGKAVSCTEQNGVYTYTFTATKSSYALTVTFGELHELTVTVDTSTMPDAAADIDVTLTDAAGGEIALQGSGGTLTAQIPYGTYTVIVTSASGEYTVLEQEVTFEEGSTSVTVNITADNYGANRKYTLEGSGNSASNYSEIQGKVGSLEGGFVFSGFFGFEGATYDELTNFTNTIYFDMADGSRGEFRFTKWGNLLMLKYGSQEYHFESDAEAVDYFKAECGVYFMFVVDGSGNVSSYIKRSADEWMCLSTSSSAKFPIGQTLNAIRFGKQDDSNTAHYAVLEGGVLQLGTTDTGIDVSFTGTGSVTGGSIEVTDATLGGEVTVTLTPEAGYVFTSLSVDGEPVECTSGADGVYTYTFTATKSSYAFAAVFEQAGGAYTVNVTIGEGLNAADDLSIVLSNGSSEYAATKGEGNVWTTESIPYGTYTIIVTSVSGGYTVLEQEVNFEEGSNSVTVNITTDNYGANRKYTLEGESATEDGVVLAENLGETTDGFVFEGFLGVGGSGSLADIGTKNYATALRFTTESGYQFRLCFYIWNGQYWLVKAFQEGKENQSGLSNEFAFTGNTVLIDYVKAQNGITVSISAAADGTLTVYAKTSDTEWVSLGTWQSPFEIDEKITQVEVLRMFQQGIEGWTATVDGELRFGISDVDIPVTFTVNDGEQVIGGNVAGTESVNIGDAVTVTLTPDEGYVFSSLNVDGESVTCQAGENGVYTYTFTVTKSSYTLAAVFEQAGGAYTVNATIAETLTGAADDLRIVLSNSSLEYAATKGEDNVWTTDSIPYGTYTVIVTSVLGGYTVLEQEVTFEEGSNSVTVNITADNWGTNRKYELEGSGNIKSSYSEIQGMVGPLEGGFVFSGFFGFEGATYDELVNFTNTVFFDMEDGSRAFRFVKWGTGLMLKYDNAEYRFESDAAAVEYFKAESGVHFMFVVDGSGNISAYIKRSADEWVAVTTGTSVTFPIDKELQAIRFGKQDDDNTERYAVLEGGELQLGTTDTEIAVSFTGTGKVTGGEVSVTDSVNLGDQVTVTLTPEEGYVFSSLNVDGESVNCTAGESGVYSYTFTASRSSHTLAAVFEQAGGTYTVNATIAETLMGAAEDLKIVLSNGSSEYAATKGTGNVWTTESIPYGKYTVIVTSVSGGYTVTEQEVTFAEGSSSVTVNITAENWGASRKYALEGSESKGSSYSEIQGMVGPLEGGFMFSGFFGFEGATYGDLTNFTNTVYFDMEGGETRAFRFTKWGDLLMLKYDNAEYRFESDAAAVEYFKAESGVHFMFVVDGSGNISAYIKRSADEWVALTTGSSVTFPIGKKLQAIRFGKQDDNDTAHIAVLKGGVLQLGTTDTGISDGSENAGK